MPNISWYDNVKLPGKGLRFYKEKEREAFWVALVLFFDNDKSKAVGKYFDWTGYNPRSTWIKEDFLEVNKEMLSAMTAVVYAIRKCEIEIIDLRAQLNESVKEADEEWDPITDPE